MPVYRPLQQELLTPAQFELRRQAEPESVAAELLPLQQPSEAEESFSFDPVAATESARPFKEVDSGRPLNIMIRSIYTGKFPEKQFLGGSRKPMLISTTIKDVTTTSAGSRAVNVLKNSVSPNSVFNGPAAAEEGTPLVYYSPAVTSSFITVGFTMIFQDFDDTMFERLSTLFSASAGVPIFMPASAYLMAASTVVKLAGGLSNQLLNDHPVLDENIQLDFSFGGGTLPPAGFWIVSSRPLDASKYQFDPLKGLIQQSNSSAYDGEDPAIIVSIDGTAVDGVSSFTPLLASASLLGRFFTQKENSEVTMDTVLDAVKLVNDLTFRKQAEEEQAKLDALPAGDPGRQKLEDKIKAFNRNIGESRLQLKLAAGA